MSRIPKWKAEKSKAKVVFRLQFEATHIPQPGWDKLFISLVSAETGKVTAKTTKANVKNGCCKWSDPIYETTRLSIDTQTKKYDEKLYKIVIATGTTRSCLLGEVNINLSEFVDAFKPFSISVPLEACEFRTILHATVQLLTSKTGFREFEQQREVRQKGLHMIPDPYICETSEKFKPSSEAAFAQTNKEDKGARYKPHLTECHSFRKSIGSSEECEDLAVGIDGSSCTSGSVYSEKCDIITPPKLGNISKISSTDDNSPLGHTAYPVKDVQDDYHPLGEGSNDLTHGWCSDYSIDNDLTVASDENYRLRTRLRAAETSISEYKMEVSTLQTIADELSKETKSIVQQLVGEITSSEALATEVSLLRSEFMKLKNDLEELKNCNDKLLLNDGRNQLSDIGTLETMLENEQMSMLNQFPGHTRFLGSQISLTTIKTDLLKGSFDSSNKGTENCHLHISLLKWKQGLTLIENKVNDIRSKTQQLHCGTGDDILDDDFQILNCVLLNLKDLSIPSLSPEQLKGTGVTDNQWVNLLTVPGCGLQRESEKFVQGRDYELIRELEVSKLEQENLTRKMNQMENYYETFIQELEDSHKNALNELEILKAEHSTCFYTVSAFQVQIEKMRQEMNGQLSRFSDERQSLNFLNKELERRANASETILKRIRQNYSVAVGRLQRDLELLSGQVLSLFETNENFAKQVFAEASQLLLHEFPNKHSGVGQLDLDKAASQMILHKRYLNEYSTGIQPIENPLAVDGASLQLDNHMPHHFSIVAQVQISKGDENPSSNGFKLEKYMSAIPLQNKSKCSGIDHVGSADLLEENTFATAVGFDPRIQETGTCSPLAVEKDSTYACIRLINEKLTPEQKKGSIQRQYLPTGAEVDFANIHLEIVHLELFVKVLQEMLHEKVLDIRRMKADISEFSRQLDNSTQSNELLMMKLQIMSENGRILRESEEKYIATCDDLSSRNNILEAKLQDLLDENSFLSEKLATCQQSLMESNLENKYMACEVEKKELELLLKQENVQKACLTTELNSIVEEYKALKEESAKCAKRSDDLSLQNHTLEARMRDASNENAVLSERLADCQKYIMEHKDFENKYRVCNAQKVDLERLFEQEAAQKASLEGELKAIMMEYTMLKSESDIKCSVIDNLEKTLYFVNEKLGDLWSRIVSCDEQISESAISRFSLGQELENGNYMAIMMYMEQCLQGATNKILQHDLANKATEEKSEITQGTLNSMELNLQDCRKKLEVSNSHAQKLQLELEGVCKKLKVTSEAKDTLEQRHTEFLQKNTVMELDLEQVKSENKILAQKLLDVDSLKEELDLTKLSATSCMHEKELLMLEVESGNRASIQLEETICGLKERLRCAENELQSGKVTSEKLQRTISELKLQLNDKCEQLSLFHGQQAEIAHLRLQTSEMESCNSQLQHILLQSEERHMKLNDEVLFLHVQVSDLERTVNFINEKLQDIFSSIGSNLNHISMTSVSCASEKVESDNKSYIALTVQVKQNLEEAIKKILQEIHEKKEIKEQRDTLQTLLNNTMSSLQDYMTKLDLSNARLEELHGEVEDVSEKLKIRSEEGSIHAQRNIELASKFTVFKYEWQLAKHENKDMAMKLLEFEKTKDELEMLKFSLLQSMHEKETLVVSLESANKMSMQMENELCALKNKLISADDELQTGRIFSERLDHKISELEFQLKEKQDMLLSFEVQKSEIACLRLQLSELEAQKSGLEYLLLQNHELQRELNDEKLSLRDRISELETEICSLKGSLSHLQNSEIVSRNDLESRVSDLKLQVNEKSEQLLLFDEQKTELAHLKQCIEEIESEISPLNYLLSQSEECRRELDLEILSHHSQDSELQNELKSIKETLRCLSNELQYERGQKDGLDIMIRDLRYQLEDRNEQILSFAKEKTDFDNVRLHISNLEEENTKLHNLLFKERDSQRSLNDCKSFLQMQAADLESQISMLYEYSLADALKVIFLSSQFQIAVDQLSNVSLSVTKSEKELVIKKEEYIEANGVGEKNQKRVDEFIDKNGSVLALAEKSGNDSPFVDDMNGHSDNKKEREIEKLRRMISSFEEEIDNLMSSREELNVTVLVLLSKFNEQKMQMFLMEEYGTALVKLQGQYNELNYRLSEQILKTEEFKNLSLHFKELKDKADADVTLIHEKKETQGGANTIQESLRMAFIKDQYESEVQELRKQLDISKMHEDELLLKLQSTLDEMEMRKKSEISHCKRNDELAKKVSELEAELKAVVINKRELVKAYDEIKAELECTSITLDCCKEEKIRVEQQLHESNEERSKFRVELDLMKRRMEILISTADCIEHQSSPCMTSFGQILEDVGSDVLSRVPVTSTTRDVSRVGDTSALFGSLAAQELDDLNLMKSPRSKDGQTTSSSGLGDICKELNLSQEGILNDNLEVERRWLKRGRLLQANIGLEEQIKEREILDSRLACIHAELETLKNDNLSSVLPSDALLVDSELKCVEKDLLRVDMTNERLENMFNSVKQFPGRMNSLESVLTLELELAQALQTKTKQNSRFKSSPLTEHDDDETIFHAFRNINELIKDMLEIKGKYVAVEGELKEMHNRYSDLSLQFAEVEGERQKLVMTLKNRAPRKQKPVSPTNSPGETK